MSNLENQGTLVIPEVYIGKEDAAELIGRHPRTLEKIWRRSQRTAQKIRKKLVRPAKGGLSEVVYHRNDLMRFMASLQTARGGNAAESPELQQEIQKLAELVRGEADRVIAELKNIRLHVEFGGRKNDER